MKKIMVLLAACAGAAGTFFWLRGGVDIGRVRDRAKYAMGRAEGEARDMMDEMPPRDETAADHLPARSPAA